jgi:signal transduction histidine kinase
MQTNRSVTGEMASRSHPIARLVAPVGDAETYRGLVFLLTGFPLAVVALTVLVSGWALVLGLAIVTPVAIVVLIGLRFAVGGLALSEAFLARELLGTPARPAFGWSGGEGFWRRGVNVLLGRAFWNQQAYLALRIVLGLPFALLELALISFALQALAAPVTYRWEALDLGFWTVDTFAEALLLVPLAPVALLVALLLVRPLTAPWRGSATRLLDTGGARLPGVTRAGRIRALAYHAAITVAVCVPLLASWALGGGGYFWPVWAILPLALVLGIHAWVVLVLVEPVVARWFGGSTSLALSAGVAALVGAFLVAVWAVTTRGYFWPGWALLGLGLAVGLRATGVLLRRGDRRAQRIEQLETTRAGAVTVQEAELRRIERDLHDGAQARLIALGMSIGMAEEKLRTDPEGAQALLADARAGAREALEELRDLARGIHPPILGDRGLEAAIAALSGRSPVPVGLTVDVPERPEAAVETAAYFVVAEALANAIKYADATRIDIDVRSSDGRLVVEVADDGRGGADPAGAGLTGLAQRAGALDGTLGVTSPAGGPTTVRAELPCG